MRCLPPRLRKLLLDFLTSCVCVLAVHLVLRLHPLHSLPLYDFRIWILLAGRLCALYHFLATAGNITPLNYGDDPFNHVLRVFWSMRNMSAALKQQ